VFLHEGLGCVAMWKDFPARVAAQAGMGALVYSRLGYGASDPCAVPRPLGYMHDEALGDLPRVLDHFGIERAILVGHSDGGSIALIYAGARPADPRLGGVVTLAAHVFCEELSVTSIRAAKRAYDEGDLRPRLARYHAGNVDVAFRGWNGAWLDPGFLAWNLEEYLPTVQAPLLVVQGEDDEYGTLAQVEAIARGAGSGAERLVLPACGHSPHKDQPDATADAIVRFATAHA
jgi:pimeloyl-ACP methyl ester carboxylesterase